MNMTTYFPKQSPTGYLAAAVHATVRATVRRAIFGCKPFRRLSASLPRLLAVVLLLLMSIANSYGSVGGLAFLNPANSIEKRTSYSVFGNADITFSRRLDLNFDMRLPYKEDVGYVVRVIDKTDGKIFNLFFDGRGNNYFELNHEGYKGLIQIHFDREKLLRKQWFKVRLLFDVERHTITMSIDGMTKSVRIGGRGRAAHGEMQGRIVFGRSDYLIDVPSFAMRNLCVADADSRWIFPLKQTVGTKVLDSHGNVVGAVISPYWLINDHYHWKAVARSSSPSPAGHAYNPSRHELLYYNRDTLFRYNLMTGTEGQVVFPSPCPVNLYLGTNFVDVPRQRLYTYETFTEHRVPDSPTVASLDLNTMQWTTEATVEINEGQMHHHGAVYSPDSRELTIYGGFARMRYSSRFYTYSVGDHHWHMRDDIRGDKFPRYFLAMGSDGQRYTYIFGGMGNESGDQTVGRRFFYDLHRLDSRTGRVEKMWSQNWKRHRDIVFSKSMVLTRDSFYVLGYSEYMSDSWLHLYRFSLRDGKHCQLGDSILIHPDRIETESSLFYDSLLHRFVAVVQEFKDSRHSTFRAYTLNAPAISEESFQSYCGSGGGKAWGVWLLAAVALLAAISVSGWLLVCRRRKKSSSDAASVAAQTPPKELKKPNSISLFGGFVARDRNNRDISYMFTDKLRQLFCVILQHTADGGISSQQLGFELWGDKSPEKVKNSKSVSLNHLRKALGDIDGVEVVYKSGRFLLTTSAPFTCDFLQMKSLLSSGEPLYPHRDEVVRLLDCGKFLGFSDAPSLDSFKSATEESLLNPLLAMLAEASRNDDSQTVLRCVKYIFRIDPVNEDAFRFQTQTLKRLGKDIELREAVILFRDAYKKTYGEDYTR